MVVTLDDIISSPSPSSTSSLPKSDRVVAKIVDFGTAERLVQPYFTSVHPVENPVWLAPEVLQRKPFNQTVDVYGYGVTCWELLARENFFGDVQFMSSIQDYV